MCQHKGFLMSLFVFLGVKFKIIKKLLKMIKIKVKVKIWGLRSK